jgi:purine nucleosidase
MNCFARTLTLTAALVLALPPLAATAQATTPEKVIFDTDIGDDVDDAYALALVCATPNFRILGVTTAFGQTKERAEVAAKLLKALGRTDIPVYAGRRGEAKIQRQYDWAKGYTSRSIKTVDAVTFMKREIERSPGEITLLAVGPLTNVGDLLTKHPEVRSKIKRVVIMGGAIHVGYNEAGPPVAEWNIKCDPAAARALFTSGVHVTMAGLESTTMLKLDKERQKRLFAYGTPGTDALAALTALWGNEIPTLFDPMAVAWAGGNRFADSEEVHVVVEDDGMTRATSGTPNATLLVKPRKDAFLDWYVQTVGAVKK